MKKSHLKSKIIRTHNDSSFARQNMSSSNSNAEYIILQVEELHNKDFDLLVEIIKTTDFNTDIAFNN